jgi:hypothetical protein
MTTKLEAALALVERGWWVFPCYGDPRDPRVRGYPWQVSPPEAWRAFFGEP